jgi:hypothetical protein
VKSGAATSVIPNESNSAIEKGAFVLSAMTRILGSKYGYVKAAHWLSNSSPQVKYPES